MDIKRILPLILVFFSLAAVFVPVSGLAADQTDDLSVYFRPAVRFGTDDRVLYILDFFVPVYRGNNDLLFVNAKFTPDNHHAWETNLGVGYRRLVMGDRLVLGGNLFYDHRKTRYGSHFDQLGLGFEAMAEPGGIGITGRFNYYQPLTRAKLGGDFGYVFYGNGIYTAGIEEAMTGFDYEAGIRIPGISNYVETWAYAGGYHYFGCHVPDVNGFSARIEAFPTDFLRLDFEYRNDTVNHDEFYGEVAFEVPFSIDNLMAGKNPFEGIGDVLTGSRTLKERMVEPVHRDVDIVIGKDYLSGLDAAGGDGHLAAGVIFVADNAGDYPGTPDGSFEHPFGTLEEAESNLDGTISIIHVLAGNGVGINGYVFDTPGLTIWGAGANNPAYPNVVNFLQGYPLITSTLTMNAPDMTVLGLSFDDPGKYAIVIDGGAANSGLAILDNRICSTGTTGIYGSLSGTLGTADSPVVISGNTISIESSTNAYGIYLSSSGNAYIRILNNHIEGLSGQNIVGIFVWTQADLIGSISGNTISDINASHNAYAIGTTVEGDFSGSISGNTITDIVSANNTAYGIRIFNNYAKSFTGSISDNTIYGLNGGANTYGIYVRFSNGDIAGSISGNAISGLTGSNEAFGIYGEAGSGSSSGSVSNNNISAIYGYNRATGIYLTATNGNYLGSITGNYLGVTGGIEAYGLYAQASNGSLGTLLSPMVFTTNSGSLNAPTAYLAFLYTNYPDLSSVFIGHNRSVNSFTTTGTWGGNYPYVGGPIWATDNGSFINR